MAWKCITWGTVPKLSLSWRNHSVVRRKGRIMEKGINHTIFAIKPRHKLQLFCLPAVSKEPSVYFHFHVMTHIVFGYIVSVFQENSSRNSCQSKMQHCAEGLCFTHGCVACVCSWFKKQFTKFFWTVLSIILAVYWLSSYVLQNRVPDKKPD